MEKINKTYIIKIFLGLICLGILAQILVTKPFYGLMDDSHNLKTLLPQMKDQGIWKFTIDYLKVDLSWGMVRLTYPPMVFLLYSITDFAGPWGLFFLNALIVMAIILLNCHAFSKVLKLNKWLMGLVVFGLLHTYDLFLHPSLQEKLVQLFGAVLILLCFNQDYEKYKRYSAILFITLVGYITKASFIIYASSAFIILLSQFNLKSNKYFIFIFSSLNLICVGFLKYIGNHGSYTARYSWARAIPNLESPVGLFYILILLLGLTWWFFNTSDLKQRLINLIPIIGIVCFLMVFLPWNLGGYLQSIVIFPVAALITLAIQKYINRNLILLIMICLFSFTFSIWKTRNIFLRLNDIGNVVKMGPQLLQMGINQIYMPCLEGSTSMDHYFFAYGKSKIKVDFLESIVVSQDLAGKTVLFDHKMCPLPNNLIHQCKTNVLYTGALKDTYSLIEVKSCP